MADPRIDILISARDQASKVFADLGDKAHLSMKQVQAGLQIGGAAMTAFGAASLKMIDTARDLNSKLSQTAITTGTSAAEMRKLALSVTDVTFPLDSVAATFETLARAGVRNTEEIAATAKAFDTLADATGSSAEVMAEALVPAYKVFGVELPKTAADLDKFSWLAHNTMVDMGDFAEAMKYVAAEGAGLGVTMDDMVAILAVLQDRGIQGSAATRLFRTAVTEAVKEGISLNDALGITNDTLAKYNQRIGVDAVNATMKYADAANTQYGIMDKLKQKFSELTLEVGTSLQPMESLFGAMTALGTAAIGLSLILPKLAASLGAITALITGPVGLVVAVGALGTAWALNFGGMRDTTDSFFNNLKDQARQASPMGTILFGSSDKWERMIGEMGPQTVKMVQDIGTAASIASTSADGMFNGISAHLAKLGANWNILSGLLHPKEVIKEIDDWFLTITLGAENSLKTLADEARKTWDEVNNSIEDSTDKIVGSLAEMADAAMRKFREVKLTAQMNIYEMSDYYGNEAAYMASQLGENLGAAWDGVKEKTEAATEAAKLYFSRAGEGEQVTVASYDVAMAEWQRIADMYASPTFKAGGFATPEGANYMTPQLPLPPGFVALGGIAPPTIYPNVPNGVQVIFQGPVYGMDDFNSKVNAAVRDSRVRGGG